MIGICLLLIAAIAGLDQLFKYLVVLNIKPVGKVTAIDHVLDLVYTENRGVAFSLFQDGRWFFIILTSIVIVVFAVLMIKNRKGSKLFLIASSLIIGGGIGNLIDRIFYGYVVDYLSLSFFPPVCNFADYCITFGAVLLVIYLLFFSGISKKRLPADELEETETPNGEEEAAMKKKDDYDDAFVDSVKR